MKKVFSTFAALLMMLTFIPAQAQQHNCWGINPGNGIIEKDYCWFDTLCSIVVIDTSNHSNIWQNGEPGKSIFTSSYSLPRAMVTDTLNTYPDNNASYFDLIIPLINNTFWMNISVSFVHKCNTDTMKDGGYIEVQYHKDSVWKNIAYDTLSFVNYMMFQCENLYSLNDTLFNSQPGFSGNTDWVTTKLQWIWTMPVKDYPPDTLRLRFHFASDNINTNKDGWMIDNLEMTSYNMGGSINENGVVKQLNCYPNPASDNTNIMLKNKPGEMYSLNIYNVYGQKAGSYENLSGENFTLVRNNLPSGLYFVVLKSCNGSIFSGKLVFR